MKTPISEVYLFVGKNVKTEREWCDLSKTTVGEVAADVRDCRKNGSDRIDIFWQKSPYSYAISVDGLNNYPEQKEIFDKMVSSFKFTK